VLPKHRAVPPRRSFLLSVTVIARSYTVTSGTRPLSGPIHRTSVQLASRKRNVTVRTLDRGMPRILPELGKNDALMSGGYNWQVPGSSSE
jgi:hypothetical protein